MSPMLAFFIIVLQIPPGNSLIECESRSISLTTKSPSWNLNSGQMAANQRCAFKITVPQNNSLLVTVKVANFSGSHFIMIYDTYSSIIDDLDISLEFPYPSVYININTENTTDLIPIIEEMNVQNIPHTPFTKPNYFSTTVAVDSDPPLYFLPTLDVEQSIMFRTGSSNNITLHALYKQDLHTRQQLINVHIYVWTAGWTPLGTLYAPENWNKTSHKYIGIFISKKINAAAFVAATNPDNVKSPDKWSLSLALVDNSTMGLYFCLNAENGTAIRTVVVDSTDYQQYLNWEVSDLIITAVNAKDNTADIQVFNSFPKQNKLLMEKAPFNLSINESEALPQSMFDRPIKTFLLETGQACVTTSISALNSGWSIPRDGRRGFIYVENIAKDFSFSSNDDVAWNYNFSLNHKKSTSTYNSVTFNASLHSNFSELVLEHEFVADNSMLITADSLNGSAYASSGSVWIDFYISAPTKAIGVLPFLEERFIELFSDDEKQKQIIDFSFDIGLECISPTSGFIGLFPRDIQPAKNFSVEPLVVNSIFQRLALRPLDCFLLSDVYLYQISYSDKCSPFHQLADYQFTILLCDFSSDFLTRTAY